VRVVPESTVHADLRDFIARYLPSVEHLEVFVVLQRQPARSWSPPEMAAELKISVGKAANILERLASDNFLDIRISNDILYRYNPATPALTERANRCAEYYLSERITVINLVTAGDLGAIRNFAEAFRFKRKVAPDA
jgi:hypothetical protein